MQGAMMRRLVLLVLVFGAGFVVAPGTVVAKPKPPKYVLVSETKGCSVTLNSTTGSLTFKAEKGHYGKFTVVVRHGHADRTYHFTVEKPKPGQELPAKPVVVPVSAPIGTPIVIIPIRIPRHTGPAGPPGSPTSGPPGSPTSGPPGSPAPIPTPPTTINPPAPPKPPPSTPPNSAPVLSVDGGVISWARDKGADTFHGAISTAPRNAAGRTTTFTVLGVVTSWKPATPPCGTTLYYGVASEGNAGEQWTANEVAIAGPKCGPPTDLTKPTITGTLEDLQNLTLHPGTWANSTSQTEVWEACPTEGQSANCQPRDGVTGDTYRTGDIDVGFSIAVVETASGPGGTSTTTVWTGPIAPPPPTLDFRDTHPPTISSPSPGQATPGQTITLQQGAWAWASGGLTDEWQACFAAEMCVDRQSGGLTYLVTADDVGTFIQVVETAHGNGTATFTTVPTISIVK
jgi:hypothetical protein